MPWGKWETGLPDDFNLEIAKAYFQFNSKLVGNTGEPRLALHLEGKAEGGSYDTPVQLEEETALLFTVGDKWMSIDGGQKVVHEGGPQKTFNQNSAIAQLIDSAVQAGVPLQDRGEPEEAKIWLGLKLHFGRKERKWKDRSSGEEKTTSALTVTGFAGEGTKASATAKPASSAKAPAGDDVTTISDLVGGAILKRLQKVAASAEDYDTFATEATELPKVKDSDEAQDIILDDERGPALWESLKG